MKELKVWRTGISLFSFLFFFFWGIFYYQFFIFFLVLARNASVGGVGCPTRWFATTRIFMGGLIVPPKTLVTLARLLKKNEDRDKTAEETYFCKEHPDLDNVNIPF